MRIHPVTTETDLEAARQIRRRVFIEEQRCPPEEEFDAHDEPGARCRHFLGRVDGRAVATARWREASWAGERVAKLERFAVLIPWRGKGRGRALVRHLLEDARRAGYTVFFLHAQTYLQELYRGFGFAAVGETFLESGIPHIRMLLRDGEAPEGPSRP